MRPSATTKHREDHAVCPDQGRGGVIALQRRAVGTRPSSTRAVIAAICLSGLLIAIFGVASARAAQPGDGFAFRGNLESIVPTGVAVDNSTGDLMVATANNILAYDSGGASAALLSTFGEGASIRGIAVDQSSHAIYTIDSTENVIDRYTRTSTAPLTYALDKTYVSPAQGSGVGQIGSFASAIAVDPSTGDLLVADSANKRVSRFAANGKFISSFDGADSNGGAFTNPQGLTVDPSGSIYVLDFDGQIRFDEAMIGTSRVERFNAAGVAQEEIGEPGEFPEGRRLAFDSNRNDLVVLAGGGEEPAGLIVYVVHEGALLSKFSDSYSNTNGTTFIHQSGVAVGGGAMGRLYIATGTQSNYGLNAVGVFDPVEFPTLAAPSAITVHGVQLSGEVFPGLEPVTPHFEISTDQVHWTRRPNLATVTEPGTVSEVITGLLANQKYYVRLVSEAADVLTSLVDSFTTPVGAPEVVTLPTSEVSTDRAALPGTINANGLLTTYHVEYGTTEAYGSRLPASFQDIVGQLRVPSQVDVVVEGLAPATTYHYRLVATSSAGTSYGVDQVLTTDATAGTARVFEQVTPVEKDGAELSRTEGFRVKDDGSAVTIGSLGLFGFVEAEGAPGNGTYYSERSESGWSIRSVDVPFSSAGHLTSIFGSSPDFSKLVTVSNEALTPGAVAGKTNFYLEDKRTGALTLAGVAPTYLEFDITFGSPPVSFFGNSDWSHFYAFTNYSLTAEAFEETPGTVYESREGQFVPLALTTANGEAIGRLWTASLSPDGRFLGYAGIATESRPGKGLFVRDGAEVIAASVSERPGDPQTPQAVSSFLWSTDGTSVIFRDEDSSALPLTAGAPEVVGNIYRYNIDGEAGHELEYIGTGVPVSTKADTVLFQRGPEPLALVAWRDGHTHVVVPALPPYEEETANLLSPNGRYVEVAYKSPLTSDSPASSRQVYLVDLDTDEVHCVSCDGTANTPPAGAGFVDSQSAPTNDGEVFFETKASLVTSDANGESDVYAYKSGHVHLISRGTPGIFAYLAGSSPSGDDVFIDTNDQLVLQDKDPASDIYDARIGGGIAAQNPSPRGACTGNACRGVTSTPPPPALLGSESLVSPGNVLAPASKPAVKSLTKAQKLAAALKACRAKREAHNRASCEQQARKRYGPKVKAKSKAKSKAKTKKTAKKSTNAKGSK
jgi:hypothetical protein